MKRLCLGGCGRLCDGTRCPDCARPIERVRTRRKRDVRPYTAAERQRRARAVAAHRLAHGDVCPGWQREPHASADLTADHMTPVAAGGHESGPLQVLCRSCNASKGSTPADIPHPGEEPHPLGGVA